VLLGQVVNQLAIDEAIYAVIDDLLALFAHACLNHQTHMPNPKDQSTHMYTRARALPLSLADNHSIHVSHHDCTNLFSLLNLTNNCHRIGLELSTKDLDLVSIHGCVSDEDLGIDKTLGLTNTESLLEDETLLQVRAQQTAASLFDNVNGIEVGTSLQAQHGIDCHGSKELLVLVEQFGRQRSFSNVNEVLAEVRCIGTVVFSNLGQTVLGRISSLAPTWIQRPNSRRN
jgi:hypothetical protein